MCEAGGESLGWKVESSDDIQWSATLNYTLKTGKVRSSGTIH